jgi:hypothetical protein
MTAVELPQDEEDIELKDPITQDKITVEGDRYTLNRELVKRQKEPFVDGNGKPLSDRVIAQLSKEYPPFPETLNGKSKGDLKTWQDKTGMTCELQTYVDDKGGYEEIRIAYNDHLYGNVIKRLREAKTTKKI